MVSFKVRGQLKKFVTSLVGLVGHLLLLPMIFHMHCLDSNTLCIRIDCLLILSMHFCTITFVQYVDKFYVGVLSCCKRYYDL